MTLHLCLGDYLRKSHLYFFGTEKKNSRSKSATVKFLFIQNIVSCFEIRESDILERGIKSRDLNGLYKDLNLNG